LVCLHLMTIDYFSKIITTAFLIFFLAGITSFIKNQGVSIKTFNFETPYPAAIQCLDRLQKEYHLRNGFADYWHARWIRMLSKRGLSLSQINKNLELTNYLDNKKFFSLPGKYQFIIVNNLVPGVIKKSVGKPDDIVFCPAMEVWLYLSRASQSRLNHFFSDKTVIEY